MSAFAGWTLDILFILKRTQGLRDFFDCEVIYGHTGAVLPAFLQESSWCFDKLLCKEECKEECLTYTSCIEGASSRNLASHVDMDASITQVEQIIAGYGSWTFLQVYAHENKWPLGCCYFKQCRNVLFHHHRVWRYQVYSVSISNDSGGSALVKGRVEDVDHAFFFFKISPFITKSYFADFFFKRNQIVNLIVSMFPSFSWRRKVLGITSILCYKREKAGK